MRYDLKSELSCRQNHLNCLLALKAASEPAAH